jgi:hypothetical protein
MAFRLNSVLLLFACAPYMPMAHGTERVGDAIYIHDLGQYTRAVIDLEREFLYLIEGASSEERFNLYWTYNHLMGAWVQVSYLQSLLELSVVAQSYADEQEIRTTLRDQTQFVLWDLNHTITDLDQNILEIKRLNPSRIDVVLRTLLAEVRMTVSRLLADQCARAPCAAGP